MAERTFPAPSVDPNHLIRVNPAESIIDPFYESQFSCLDRYDFRGFIPGRTRWSQDWHFLNLRMDVAEGDGLLGSLTRSCDIDVSAYDRFCMRLSLSATVRIVAALTIDGREQRVIDATGPGEFRELSGVFSGRKLEGIRIELHALRPGRAVGMIEWTMLASSEALAFLQSRRPVYDSTWKGYLREDVGEDAIRPCVGIYFGAGDLESLRRKAASPLYAAAMANLRSTAARFMALTPERSIDEVARYLYPFTRDRIYYIEGMPEFFVGASSCAFLGLLDGDLGLLRMAARIALSTAMCGSWDAWIDTVPETVWEDRGFPNFIIGVGCAMALDWAGCMFTDQGKEVLVKALADKALPRIQQSLMKHDYMWYSNQGVWDLYGYVVCTVAIASRWKHGDMVLDQIMEILNGIIDRYVEEDGGAFEGVNYQVHTMAFAMMASVAYGRLRGRPPSEVASKKLAGSAEYLLAVASEGSHPGSALPLADGGPVGAPMAAHCVALLHRLYRKRELEPLLGLLAPRIVPDISMRIDNPALLVFGPEAIGEQPLATPVFRILHDSCILTSSRPTSRGNVRVVLTGCQEKDAGHSHHDRGSLIVEAFGETLLNEVGMVGYEIPEHVLLGEPRYHCLACPGPLDALPRQVLPTPGRIQPEGSGDERNLRAEVDLKPAWGAAVESAARRIESDTPEELTVIDSFRLPSPGPVTVVFNTTGSIREVRGGWRVEVGTAWAEILPEWTPARRTVPEHPTNAAGERTRALMLEAPAATSHRLVTLIRLGTESARRSR